MSVDFSKYGTPVNTNSVGGSSLKLSTSTDFSKYGTPIDTQQTSKKDEGIIGGTVGELLTGNTQRFGKTIGQSIAAPGNADLYAGALASHTKIQNDLIKSIAAKKKLGQDTSRLEHVLQDHIKVTPKLEDFTGDVINKSAEQVIGEGIGTGLEALSGGAFETGAKTVVSKTVPLLSKLKTGAKIGAAFGGVGNLSGALQNNEGVEDTIRSVGQGASIGAGLGVGGELLGAGASKLPGLIKGLTPESAKIMQRVARISKGKQANFEKMAGESVGDYLVKRNIYGNIDGITDGLYKRFEASKGAADEALASLPGTYTSEPLKTALNELSDRETRVSSPGAKSPDIDRVSFLKNKNETQGLTMSEINETKRLYERNVKLDFLKQNLPESVARANNIDNSLRNWQFEQADKLGLKNLPEINKETRLSKQLLNDIGKEYSGSAGNNAINLTDWIMLSGGNPHSLAGFLVKKTLSSKGVQSKAAQLLSKLEGKSTIGMPKAEYGGKKGLPALIPGRDYRVPIEMGGPKSANTIEKPAQKIFNQNYLEHGKNSRLALPPGNKKLADGEIVRLPGRIGTRETSLGLDEVKNSTRSTPQQQPPLEKLEGKSLPDNIPRNKGNIKAGLLAGGAAAALTGLAALKPQKIQYQGLPSIPSKNNTNVIDGIDISSYATDPQHESRVSKIYSSLPELPDAEASTTYIQQKFPKSPITGDMVITAAQKYDVSPKLLVAIMQQDSGLGTKGLGMKTRNPGNVGNNDSGKIVKYPSWKEGVEGVARFLAKNKIK